MINKNQYIQVYWNFHKKCFSVQNRDRIVIDYCDQIAIENAEFFVSEAGRQRVLKEQRKNVHAKVRGNKSDIIRDKNNLREVIYNPYKFDSFVFKDTKKPIRKSNYVLLENGKVYTE